MKKKVLIISLAALLFLLALGLTLYPLIANRYNQRHQSEIHTAYQEQVAQADKTEIIAAREKAITYNETLVSGVQSDDAWLPALCLAGRFPMLIPRIMMTRACLCTPKPESEMKHDE